MEFARATVPEGRRLVGMVIVMSSHFAPLAPKNAFEPVMLLPANFHRVLGSAVAVSEADVQANLAWCRRYGETRERVVHRLAAEGSHRTVADHNLAGTSAGPAVNDHERRTLTHRAGTAVADTLDVVDRSFAGRRVEPYVDIARGNHGTVHTDAKSRRGIDGIARSTSKNPVTDARRTAVDAQQKGRRIWSTLGHPVQVHVLDRRAGGDQ